MKNAMQLKAALSATSEKRGSKAVVMDYRRIIKTVKNSEIMQKQWDNYQKDFEYATDILFKDTCDIVLQLMDSLMKTNVKVFINQFQTVMEQLGLV